MESKIQPSNIINCVLHTAILTIETFEHINEIKSLPSL